MDSEQFRVDIVQATLKPLKLWSEDAEALLCATAAQESLAGKYVRQVGGPALGVYQMEPATHDSLWRTKLGRPDKLSLVRAMLTLFGFNRKPSSEDMIWHLGYATFMARMHYLFINKPLPSYNNLEEQWAYYKQYWNTELGAAKYEDFIRNVNNFNKVKKR